jgi:hypothetical protein
MPYLDGYMRGGMPSIIGLSEYVRQGYDAGKARAQNERLAQLSQAAFNDTGAAQSQDVSQAIGIDPKYGYSLAGQVGAQSAAQQKQAQMAKFGKIATAILAAKQRGDDAAAEGIYQAAKPELQATFPNANAPATLGDDPAIWGNLEKVAAVYGQLPTPEKGVVLSAGAQLRNPTTGALMASVPSAPKITPQGYQAVLGPDGTYHAEQIPIGAGNGVGVGSAGTGAPAGATPPNVQFEFAPGTPPEVIAAAKAAAAAQGAGAQGSPQTLAGAMAAGKAHGQAAPSGYQWNAAHTGLEPIPGGPADKGNDQFQGGDIPMPGDPSLSGAEYMQSVPQNVRTLAEGLIDGTKPWPTGTVLKNGTWAQAVMAAQHADPSLNAATYQQRAKARDRFTNGKQGDMLRQLRTISAHADQYTRDVLDLDNSNFTPYNKIRNSVGSAFGAKAPGNVQTDALAVSEEVSKFLTGGVPAVTTIDEWKDNLGANASRDQQIARITRVIGIVGGQLQSLVQQYKSAMGPVSQPLAVVNPQAAEAFQHLVETAHRFNIKLPPHVLELQDELSVPTDTRNPVNVAPSQRAPQGPAVGTVEGGYRFKGGDPANQANWEPVQ